MPGRPSELVPVAPEAAAAALVDPAEQQIRDLQQAVDDLRTRLQSLTPLYYEGRRLRNRLEAFDLVTDVNRVQSLLDHFSLHCSRELLSIQPGGARPPEMLSRARESSLKALSRDICIRTIYQHTARTDLPTRAYVREITEQGAEVRTVDQVIDKLIIYDREVAFLPERHNEQRKAGAAIVREPTLVAFLCSVFEYLWENGSPFLVESQRAAPAPDDLKRSILQLMAKGYKDEMIARRLGMAVRTCRRHIAELTEELEATSRFQAGYNAARKGLLDYGP
ncbi:helix-turn-helix transcriptional regulator [Streptomyces sp. NPDC051940]|uniref:helix-turn-helix transcriptional regulator n=1 Tax=Streptomyces sp. NPDC051940 TaxID=3155675 RepID=UPI0034274461